MRFFVLLCNDLVRKIEQRHVLPVLQLGSLVRPQHLIRARSLFRKVSQHLIEQRLCHIISIAVRRLDLAVRLVRVHTQRHVARQRPGCRRPRQKIGVLAHNLKAHNRGALLDRLVALRHLLRGERSSAARAVGHDLKALVEQLLVPDLL